MFFMRIFLMYVIIERKNFVFDGYALFCLESIKNGSHDYLGLGSKICLMYVQWQKQLCNWWLITYVAYNYHKYDYG